MTPALDYLDFDLEVEAGAAPGSYNVTVVNSPRGEASGQMVFPFDPVALENTILKLGRTRSGVRAIGSPTQQVARDFGTKLYDAVFAGEVGTCFRRSLDEADARGKGLRVRLRLGRAPQLADVPWEYLYPTGLRQFLVLSTKTPVVRYMEQPRAVAPLAITPPLQVLVVVASPTNLATLDVGAEVNRISSALAGLQQSGMVQLTVAPNGTLAELRRTLRRGEFHVLHFIGHGGFNPNTAEGMLAFEDEHRVAHLVSGTDLATMVHDHATLRLVVLNACEGARQSPADPLGGVAQSLVAQGIPAVVAMQFEITDVAATVFSAEFYSALADGYPIDAALAEARVAVFSDDNDVEWGTPVLYLRSSDGRIFDLSGAPPPTAPPVTPTPPPTPTPGPGPAPIIPVIVPQFPTPEPVPAAPPPAPGRLPIILGAVAGVVVLSLGTWWALGAMVAPPPVSPTPTAASISASPTATTTPTLPPVVTVPPLKAVATKPGTLTIDGRTDDWQWQLVSRAIDPIIGAPKATGDIYLMWDEEALYVLAKVADPELDPPSQSDPSRGYRGDGVVLELGPDPRQLAAGDLARPVDAYYIFGLPEKQLPVIAILGPNAKGTSFEVPRDPRTIDAAFGREPGGYILEARIPWATTQLNGIAPGTVLAANVLVSDRRPSNLSNLGMVSTNPQRSALVRAHPAYWQQLELLP